MIDKVPTYNELTNRQDIVFISEYNGFRYIKLKATELYENLIWKVDMVTKRVFRMNFVDYLCDVDSKAKYIFSVPEWKP